MARNQEVITCPADEWTQLTNDDVSEITFQVLRGPVYIVYTVGANTPTQTEGALYVEGLGEAQRELTTLTSLSGANRVYARPADMSSRAGPSARVYVDHV
jgi:hypothetical protein